MRIKLFALLWALALSPLELPWLRKLTISLTLTLALEQDSQSRQATAETI